MALPEATGRPLAALFFFFAGCFGCSSGGAGDSSATVAASAATGGLHTYMCVTGLLGVPRGPLYPSCVRTKSCYPAQSNTPQVFI